MQPNPCPKCSRGIVKIIGPYVTAQKKILKFYQCTKCKYSARLTKGVRAFGSVAEFDAFKKKHKLK